MRTLAASRFLLLAMLAACADPYQPTLRPRLHHSGDAEAARPPSRRNCPSWASETTDPYDNQPVPQFGCANARNLALMAEQPRDLVTGPRPGPAPRRDGGRLDAALQQQPDRAALYLASCTDWSVDITTAPTATSTISGEVTSPAGDRRAARRHPRLPPLHSAPAAGARGHERQWLHLERRRRLRRCMASSWAFVSR